MKFKKYFIEIILFTTYMLFAMSWKSGDMLIAKMGFTASQMALMTNAINIAKIIGCLSAATIIAKLGNRKVFSYSTLLIFLGVLLAFTKLFPLIFLVRFILGLGGALVLVTINPIVSKIFSKEELPIINGLNAVAFNVGLAVVLTFSKAIANNPTMAIYVITALLVLILILWLILSKDLDDNKIGVVQADNSYTMLDGFKDKFNWVFALSYCGLLGFYLVSFTFMKAETVKFVIYLGVVGALMGTFQAQKVKDKLKLVRISAFMQLLSAIAFMMLYNTPYVIYVGMLLGFFIFYPMAAFVTLAFTRPNVTTKQITVTFSIFWAMSYFASIIIIQLFAFLKDTMGDSPAFVFIVLVESTFFIGNMFFMKPNKTVEVK